MNGSFRKACASLLQPINMLFTGINQLSLVSFKNIDICLSYAPYFCISFLHKFFWAGNFYGTHETVIYPFFKSNPSYHVYFQILVPTSLGPQNPTKKLVHWMDLLINCYLKKMLSTFSGLNPL